MGSVQREDGVEDVLRGRIGLDLCCDAFDSWDCSQWSFGFGLKWAEQGKEIQGLGDSSSLIVCISRLIQAYLSEMGPCAS